MQLFKADLHIHSVLSPCADLDMGPVAIVEMAKKQSLDIIAVTDHNGTHNIKALQQVAHEHNICVIPGVEVNTAEEIHLLAYFPDLECARQFQAFMDAHMPKIKNRDQQMGQQLVVDENENILEEIDHLLVVALQQPIDEIVKEIRRLNGLAIPAHINRPSMSIVSQLGFIPTNLVFDALEQSRPINKKLKALYPQYTTISWSDAHFPGQIGQSFTQFRMSSACFEEIKLALHNQNGRGTQL
jgi:3',5'-nucleoside bisphosphate phosphatase